MDNGSRVRAAARYILPFQNPESVLIKLPVALSAALVPPFLLVDNCVDGLAPRPRHLLLSSYALSTTTKLRSDSYFATRVRTASTGTSLGFSAPVLPAPTAPHGGDVLHPTPNDDYRVFPRIYTPAGLSEIESMLLCGPSFPWPQIFTLRHRTPGSFPRTMFVNADLVLGDEDLGADGAHCSPALHVVSPRLHNSSSATRRQGARSEPSTVGNGLSLSTHPRAIAPSIQSAGSSIICSRARRQYVVDSRRDEIHDIIATERAGEDVCEAWRELDIRRVKNCRPPRWAGDGHD
ncbi:hypothetical protein C8R45DRAFT_1101620 [Mycena sanguinolenta]|nr:hypothetical protein C8R45DRAFT_1101620 [Mycena sanguinolenta]